MKRKGTWKEARRDAEGFVASFAASRSLVFFFTLIVCVMFSRVGRSCRYGCKCALPCSCQAFLARRALT